MNTAPINNELVLYDDLIKVTKANSPAELAAWLASNDVPYFRAQDRGKKPFTTKAALNKALGVLPMQSAETTKSNIEIG